MPRRSISILPALATFQPSSIVSTERSIRPVERGRQSLEQDSREDRGILVDASALKIPAACRSSSFPMTTRSLLLLNAASILHRSWISHRSTTFRRHRRKEWNHRFPQNMVADDPRYSSRRRRRWNACDQSSSQWH
jgi:hypothetical protein